MKTILIVGMGQIGSSIYEIYKRHANKYDMYYLEEQDITSRNLDKIKNLRNEDLDSINIDYMHVCIPYNESIFKSAIVNYVRELLPSCVIIHSTVDIGTTRAIYNEIGVPICYSPCMGVHPNLTKGILTFEKILGSVEDRFIAEVKEHLEDADIKVKVYSSAENAEAAKLLDTTYYGWNIIFMKEVHKFCEQYGLEFNEVYKATNEIYNTGYEKLDMSHVRRPVLKHIPGKIGGHCVTPNARILRKYFTPAKVILEWDND